MLPKMKNSTSRGLLSLYACLLAGNRTAGLIRVLDRILTDSMEALDGDIEQQAMAQIVIDRFRNVTLQEIVSVISDQILGSDLHTKWQTRLRQLSVIQVLFFRHIFIMSDEEKRQILDFIMSRIDDHSFQVRQLAGTTLSGIIRCAEYNSIEYYKDMFIAKLDSKDPEQVASGIMGSLALVSAFPYSIPSWMPDLLFKIASSPASSIVLSVFTC